MQFVSIIAKVLKYDSGVVETSLDYCEDYEICSMNDLPHELRNCLKWQIHATKLIILLY